MNEEQIEGAACEPGDFLAHGVHRCRLIVEMVWTLEQAGHLPPRASPEDDPHLSDAQLVHLGAVGQIVEWERAGFRSSLPDYIPPADVAIVTVLRQIEANGAIQPNYDLVHRVLRAWMETFAHRSALELGVDIAVLSTSPPEVLLNDLADLLWSFRHLAPAEEGSNATS